MKLISTVNENQTNIENIQLSCYTFWKIFERRFVDYLNMIIIHEFVYNNRDNLNTILDKKFSPGSSEEAQKWICEDKTISNLRENLERTLAALKEAKICLDKIF